MNRQPPTARREVRCDVTSGDPGLCCTILDNMGEGVLSMGLDKKIMSFNPAAENMTGFKREEAIGQYCFDIFRTNICTSHCVMEKSIETGERQENVRALIINKTGNEIPVSVSTSFLRDEKGDVIGLIEIFRDLSEVEKLKRHLSGCYTTEDIIGKNTRMQEIFAILPDIAESDSAVLIEGPSGSGKELFARAIHHLSPRREGEFVAINCGAMPDTLLESELFGYAKGAFTGATRNKPGRLLLADQGTLFLDEIGNTSTAFQADLLRVLERKEFVPLGDTKPVKSDFRVICATNSEIKAMAREGTFREDLYYRLNVVKISLPGLNEKRDDIPLLVAHFIEKYNLLKSRSVRGVTDDLMSCFMDYTFPGNVRELENLIEYAYILCKG
ncbi:MAG: sigma 54-interacting transcriptional regulator, partial [Deltaproteobacteria bacterium]|nr:sigma 54-interacting transcriptional regulator [Deltaproteobacteria bacterium]